LMLLFVYEICHLWLNLKKRKVEEIEIYGFCCLMKKSEGN